MLLSEFVGRIVQLNGGDIDITGDMVLAAYTMAQGGRRRRTRKAVASPAPAAEVEAPVVKRPRGRPRKVVDPTAQQPPVVKRPRGRPPKVPRNTDQVYLEPELPKSKVTVSRFSDMPELSGTGAMAETQEEAGA